MQTCCMFLLRMLGNNYRLPRIHTALVTGVSELRKQPRARLSLFLLYRRCGGTLLSLAGKPAPGSRHT